MFRGENSSGYSEISTTDGEQCCIETAVQQDESIVASDPPIGPLFLSRSDGAILASDCITHNKDCFDQSKIIQHVAVDVTKEDRSCLSGTAALFVYVGVWIFSWLSFPLTILLFILRRWIAGTCLTIAIVLCYVLPIRANSNVRALARRHFTRYFEEASISFEHVPKHEIERPTILCVNPHGIFSMSWAMCFLTDELNHIYYCFSNLLRLSPFLRIVTQLIGHPSAVSKDIVLEHLRHGRSIAIIPGAWQEATLHHHQKDRLFIQSRQGFIKYALQYGYTITPTYCFGEKGTYQNLQGCYPLRFWLNQRKFSTVFPLGQWWCPFLPCPVKLHTVVGSPIELPHVPTPSSADINYWHQIYIYEIIRIFQRYKHQFYDDPNAELELW